MKRGPGRFLGCGWDWPQGDWGRDACEEDQRQGKTCSLRPSSTSHFPHVYHLFPPNVALCHTGATQARPNFFDRKEKHDVFASFRCQSLLIVARRRQVNEFNSQLLIKAAPVCILFCFFPFHQLLDSALGF